VYFGVYFIFAKNYNFDMRLQPTQGIFFFFFPWYPKHKINDSIHEKTYGYVSCNCKFSLMFTYISILLILKLKTLVWTCFPNSFHRVCSFRYFNTCLDAIFFAVLVSAAVAVCLKEIPFASTSTVIEVIPLL
jgi:hypothetical protein